MSLYYDAAFILSSDDLSGSLKSKIYNKNANFKSKPAHIYALICETAKHDTFLKEVIEHAEILKYEHKLTPLLAVLLLQDHFFAKSGIAASGNHILRQTIERHKGRLQSEFTKARLRRRAPNIEQLKVHLLRQKGVLVRSQPRWIRVNTISQLSDSILNSAFADYAKVESVSQVIDWPNSKLFHIDEHVPDLLAFSPNRDLTKSQEYLEGSIILQDKASCFPAYLLLGDQATSQVGDVIDGCAAPGNKTTHLAAIMATNKLSGTTYACERDSTRSSILQMMVKKARAEKIVTVLARQDFLALDPNDARFANVTHLLLDPSCSGSGILGREDVPKLSLPEDPRAKNKVKGVQGSKKRKRDDMPAQITDNTTALDTAAEEEPILVDRARLKKLSNLQSLIVEHAFSFPLARRVTYSTCSIHVEENEAVVERVLRSDIAIRRGWRVLWREEQVQGMKLWKHRGVESPNDPETASHNLNDQQREACIRCVPNDDEGTMGFFVCGFTRDADSDGGINIDDANRQPVAMYDESENEENEENEDEWGGFED